MIEYNNADAYVHLWGFIDGWMPVCWIFVARTERKSISYIFEQKKKKKKNRQKVYNTEMQMMTKKKKVEFSNKY